MHHHQRNLVLNVCSILLFGVILYLVDRHGTQYQVRILNNMAIFVHAKGGLMVEFSIGGQKFSFEPV